MLFFNLHSKIYSYLEKTKGSFVLICETKTLGKSRILQSQLLKSSVMFSAFIQNFVELLCLRIL